MNWGGRISLCQFVAISKLPQAAINVMSWWCWAGCEPVDQVAAVCLFVGWWESEVPTEIRKWRWRSGGDGGPTHKEVGSGDRWKDVLQRGAAQTGPFPRRFKKPCRNIPKALLFNLQISIVYPKTISNVAEVWSKTCTVVFHLFITAF